MDLLELPVDRFLHVLLGLAVEWNSATDEQVKQRKHLLTSLAEAARGDAHPDDEDPNLSPLPESPPDLHVPPHEQATADLPIPGLRELPLGVNARG